jgi:hypothetical protein
MIPKLMLRLGKQCITQGSRSCGGYALDSDRLHPGPGFIGGHREFVLDEEHGLLLLPPDLELPHAADDVHGSHWVRVLQHTALSQGLDQSHHKEEKEADKESDEDGWEDGVKHSMIIMLATSPSSSTVALPVAVQERSRRFRAVRPCPLNCIELPGTA